ncbi:MAG: His/Gly/Thr/Pro-type tRNA ligase C-terminal domain-containing protein, partial [Actinomycetota bacterium]
LSDEARPLAFAQMLELRKLGFTADIDYAGRKAKGQMKQADRLGAGLTVIIGDDELKSGKATVRDMQKGEQTGVEIGELSEYLAGLLGQ